MHQLKEGSQEWLAGYPTEIPSKLGWEPEYQAELRIHNWQRAYEILYSSVSKESIDLANLVNLDISKTPKGLLLAELPNTGHREFGLTASTISVDHDLVGTKFSVRFDAAGPYTPGRDRLYSVAALPKKLFAASVGSDENVSNGDKLRIAAHKDLSRRKFVLLPDELCGALNGVNTNIAFNKIRISQYMEAELLKQGFMSTDILEVMMGGKRGLFAGLARSKEIPYQWQASFIFPKNTEGTPSVTHGFEFSIAENPICVEIKVDLPFSMLKDCNFHREDDLRYGLLVNKVSI